MDDFELEKCDCGRSYCEFFAAGYGEYGTSFSREELENMQKEITKALAL